MMKPGEPSGDAPDVATELKRIITISLLSLVLLLVAIALDTPVSILAWMLLAAALLCLMYIVLASRQLLIHLRSLDCKAEPHD
jgi:hypothetical protein